jgi:predicted nucleic acid-binding protein
MKIYLETTIFNYYFDADRDAHPATVQLFKEITAGKFEPYTSIYVIDELKNTQTDKREKMLNLIS